MSTDFAVFSPQTIDFLWGIRLNNRRDWFEAHKQDYLQTLYRPMQALAAEIFLSFSDQPGCLCKVSRIYRDVRYAHAAPYKESLWFCIRSGDCSWAEEPTLFFELRPETYSCGFLLWSPKAAWMQAFRKNVLDRPEPFLQTVQTVQKTTGLDVSGLQYKREKFCPNPLLQPYWNLKNLMAIRECPVDNRLFSANLAQDVRTTLENLLPLQEYCKGICVE